MAGLCWTAQISLPLTTHQEEAGSVNNVVFSVEQSAPQGCIS